ncbi:FAD-binding, type 2 [Pseudocohnilembus persalinus]|uniref:FAD-binding, type 2 n=1 Tax=Pseudocohnilembus persalinus TaxID=266149 RepID=A0A0V0QT97_PSEPJ|nr:FAD-binding, type 2 [Pseudocohnilembus persalinus]|eukprot:KRX05609.1 FAD-binding, type 2 [Pseudocohnilembus persalinus]
MVKINTNSILLLLALLPVILSIPRWTYTQPGDENWPCEQQFQDFGATLDGEFAIRGSSNYEIFNYNLRTNNPQPAIIVYAINEQDVVKALQFARQHEIRVSVSSTGFHQDNRNVVDNGVHISLAKMKQIDIDLQNERVVVQTGNRVNEVIAYLGQNTNNQYVIPVGGSSTIGIYGFNTQGGVGALTRLIGLGADNVIGARMVLVNGQVIDVDENNHPDLLRAIRGSGASTYGVGISLTFKLSQQPGKVSTFTGKFFSDQFADINTAYQQWQAQNPNFVSGKLFINGQIASFTGTCFGDDCADKFDIIDAICEQSNNCALTLNKYNNFYDFYAKVWGPNGYQTDEYLIQGVFENCQISNVLSTTQQFIQLYEDFASISCYAFTDIGGVVKQLDPNHDITAIAPALREADMMMTCSVDLSDLTIYEKETLVGIMDYFADNYIKKQSIDEFVYWNEAQHNVENWEKRYWGKNKYYRKLLKVKRQYDPENFLTCYHCIGYNQDEEAAPALCPTNNCSCSNVYDENVCANTSSLSQIDEVNQVNESYEDQINNLIRNNRH